LHYLSEKPAGRQVALVQSLVSRGWAVDGKDKEGWTPMHFAALNQSASAVDALVAAAAKVDIKDAYGCTPLYTAVVNYKGDKRCVQALLRAGARPGVMNNAGLSPRSIMDFGTNRTFRRFFAA
jgi:uncharacterized protein